VTTEFDVPRDPRLVVADMDGTLLDPDGSVPDGFWPLLERMEQRGIRFVPASGRQYYTLEALFARVAGQISYIAENGGLVVHEGRSRVARTIDPAITEQVVRTVRGARQDGAHLDLVVCGRTGGYVEERDTDDFATESAKYYLRLSTVDDLLAVDDEILKLAVFDPVNAADSATGFFGGLDERCQVVVSGRNWIDMMAFGVDKGAGVRILQEQLGVTPEQTVVFGDYLNDLQMLDAADWSYAMADGNEQVRRRARFQAPPNREQGVLTVLSAMLGD